MEDFDEFVSDFKKQTKSPFDYDVVSYGFIMPEGCDNIEIKAPEGTKLKDAYLLFDNFEEINKE